VLLLFLLVLAGGSSVASAGSQGLTLFLDFHEPPPPRVIAALQSEVERLIAPEPGILHWKKLAENLGAGSPVRVAVVHFDGRCDASLQTSTLDAPRRWVLGSAAVSDGRVLPVMNVECDRVRAFLSTHPLNMGEQTYGRALGQVIAHELYHILLGTGVHSLKGISKAVHSSRELGKATNDFDPSIRARLSAALVERNIVPPTEKSGTE
jgi:hypothetical protein